MAHAISSQVNLVRNLDITQLCSMRRIQVCLTKDHSITSSTKTALAKDMQNPQEALLRILRREVFSHSLAKKEDLAQ